MSETKQKNDVAIVLKEAFLLFAITLVAGLLLGFVYELTKDPIRLQHENAIQAACRDVFADADHFTEIVYTPGERVLNACEANGTYIETVYMAKSQSEDLLGYVLSVSTNQGYGGTIVLYLGVRNDGMLNGISILEISETAGLGMEAENVLVPQFSMKQEEAFTYTKTGSTGSSEIDAISGATITTKAVVGSVNTGLLAAKDLQEGGANE